MSRYAVRIMIGQQVAASATIEAENRAAAIQEAAARLERDGHDISGDHGGPALTFVAQPYEGSS